MEFDTLHNIIKIEDSIDELNEVVESLDGKKDSYLTIYFKITNNEKWRRFTAVFPKLPDFVDCKIYGDLMAMHARILNLCFSGGRYYIENVNCKNIFVTGNTELRILSSGYIAQLSASQNADVTVSKTVEIIEIYAKGNSKISCNAETNIRAIDNSTIISYNCNNYVHDCTKIKAINGSVCICSEKTTTIAYNAQIIIQFTLLSAYIQAICSTIYFTSKFDTSKILKDKFTRFIIKDRYCEDDYDGAYIDPRTYLSDNQIYYKCVVKDENGIYHSIWDNEFTYTLGETILPNNFKFDSNATRDCGPGIHIATLEWALSNYYLDNEKMAILEVEVPEDAEIVVPYASTGKLRASKVKVLREVPIEECGVLGEIYSKFKE